MVFLDYIRSVASGLGEVIILICSALMRHIWSAGSSCGVPGARDMWRYWKQYSKGSRRWLKDWNIPDIRKGWESWDFSAWRREDSRRSYQCIWIPEGKVERKWSQALFSDVQWQGKRHKLKHRRFRLNISKHLFTVRVTEHWHRLSREIMESPSLELFKSCLDTDRATCFRWPCLNKGSWTRLPPGLPCTLNHSVSLWYSRGWKKKQHNIFDYRSHAE